MTQGSRERTPRPRSPPHHGTVLDLKADSQQLSTRLSWRRISPGRGVQHPASIQCPAPRRGRSGGFPNGSKRGSASRLAVQAASQIRRLLHPLGNACTGSAAAAVCGEDPLGPALTRLPEGPWQRGSTWAGNVMSHTTGPAGELAVSSRGMAVSPGAAQQGRACPHGLPPPHLPPKSQGLNVGESETSGLQERFGANQVDHLLTVCRGLP